MNSTGSILWEGRVPLSEVSWSFDLTKRFHVSPSFEKRRRQVWNSMHNQFPHLYDGEILILDDFSTEKNTLKLSTWGIPFSVILVHQNDNLKVPKYGSLGFQAIISNPSHSHLLVGERSHVSEYMPGYLTLPGGIFESTDLEKSLVEACLREINEEISISTIEESFQLIAILPEIKQLGTCLLVEAETTETNNLSDSNHKIIGNEEWENNQLEWIPFSRISTLDRNRLMEGLCYLQGKLMNKAGKS